MLNRREFLVRALAGALAGVTTTALASKPLKLVFVHGRSQQDKDPTELKATWMDALKRGADKIGMRLPSNLEVAFPYYGDTLDEFTRQFNLPLTSDIQSKGSAVNEEFLNFQADIAEALRQQRGITDEQINAEYGDNPKPKGPLNWEWVQAILRALDKHGGGFNQFTLETFTRDVFLYTKRSVVHEKINQIVASSITEDPTIIVGHSLGSVVAYSVLRSDTRALKVSLFVTIGSPLGVRAIRDQFKPLRYPSVGSWYNAFDDRDVVSLYPLNTDNFPVTPAVENYDEVKNHTDNRHGIAGYLDDPSVANRILAALSR